MESGQMAQVWLAPYERAFARDTNWASNGIPNPRCTREFTCYSARTAARRRSNPLLNTDRKTISITIYFVDAIFYGILLVYVNLR